MIIFCKTRYDYQSYDDFWELVELSGFPIIYVDEIDWQSDNTYIFTPLNGEMPRPLPDHKCKVIWLNIERPTGEHDHKLWKMFDEVWVCDKTWAKKTGAKFFFMASDKRLGYSGKHDQPPISLAYINPRREEKYNQLGLNNTNCFGQEKKKLLAEAKALVVLHQDVPVLSPQRFCVAAASHLPVFYEQVGDFYPLVEGKDFIPISYENCVDVFNAWIGSDKLQQIGENLYKIMCEYTNFRKEVEKC